MESNSHTSLTTIKNQIVFPENKYEQVLFAEELAINLHQFADELLERVTTLKIELADSEDENYKCEKEFSNRKSSTLDIEKFADELPDIYSRTLSIKATDAEKLLGKDKLRDLVIEEVGWENFCELANVTLTDARKNIPKSLLPNYITEEYKPIGYKIVKK